MAYIEQCVKEHIQQMQYRIDAKERALIKLTAEIETLKEERADLENGINNWIEEELDQ